MESAGKDFKLTRKLGFIIKIKLYKHKKQTILLITIKQNKLNEIKIM